MQDQIPLLYTPDPMPLFLLIEQIANEISLIKNDIICIKNSLPNINNKNSISDAQINSDSDSDNIENIKKQAVLIIENQLQKYLNQEERFAIKECNGFISGSFVYNAIMHVIHGDDITKPRDIDIFIPIKGPNNNDGYYDNKLYQLLDTRYQVSIGSCYNIMSDYVYTSYYFTRADNSTMYNIIYYDAVASPKNLVKRFDLDCCKNYYKDGAVYIYDLAGLTNRETIAKPGAYDLSAKPLTKLYNLCEKNDPNKKYQHLLTKTHDYVKLQMLIDVYNIDHKKCTNYPVHQYHDKFTDQMVEVCAWQYVDQLRSDLAGMDTMFNIFKKLGDYVDCKIDYEIDQDIIDLMNIVKCYYRIKKYEATGIKNFKILF